MGEVDINRIGKDVWVVGAREDGGKIGVGSEKSRRGDGVTKNPDEGDWKAKRRPEGRGEKRKTDGQGGWGGRV